MSGLLLLTLAILAQSLSLPPQLDLISHPSDNVAFPNGSSSSSTVQNLTAGPSYYCDMRYGSLTTPEPCNDAFRKIPIYAYDQKFVFRRYEHGPDDKFV